MPRRGQTVKAKDLVFTDGSNSAQSFEVQDKLYVKSGSGSTLAPTKTLTLGDSDTGFQWISDGNFELHANNQKIGAFTSNDINWYKPMSLNNNSLSGVTSIYGQYGTLIQSGSDEWLRINGDGTHIAGVFFGTSVTRTDGSLQVGSAGSAFKADSAGAVTASASMTAPVLKATSYLDVPSASAPAHSAGRIYYNGSKLQVSDGTKWNDLGGADTTAALTWTAKQTFNTTVDINQTNGRLVIPVGADKWAT